MVQLSSSSREKNESQKQRRLILWKGINHPEDGSQKSLQFRAKVTIVSLRSLIKEA